MAYHMATLNSPAPIAEIPAAFPLDWTLADLQEYLGGIPPERIRLFPAPGLATVDDWERLSVQKTGLLELVDGVLIQKPVSLSESKFTTIWADVLGSYRDKNDLGFVLGPSGPFQFQPGQVRLPDASFVRWNHFPDRKLPRATFLWHAPDLAIEVLSKENTRLEMDRKLSEYFQGGAKLVWYVDPAARTLSVFSSVDDVRVATLEDEIDGGDVLPGFTLSIQPLFSRADKILRD